MTSLLRRQMPEVAAAVLLLLTFLGSLLFVPAIRGGYLFDMTSLYAETGIIALIMTFIIVSGNIDLSVASTMALVSVATGVLTAHLRVPMPVALLLGLGLGALLGLCNGLLVALLRLPSLTVTLGTFALYRGIAQILLGDQSVSAFPEWFVGVDYRKIGPIPLPLLIFLALAIALGFALHRTMFGRWTYSLGSNSVASRLSGVPVRRVQIMLFTLSGLCAGFAGLLMTSRLTVARYDMAQSLELDAITAVVLGGTDIFGGRGTMAGTVMAWALVALLRESMGLQNVKTESQLIVIGLLLIASIVIPNLLQRRSRRARA
jgi:rhamnose transport system permease protein